MDTLLTSILVLTGMAVAALAFGIFCIKYGVYTSGNHNEPQTLEI